MAYLNTNRLKSSPATYSPQAAAACTSAVARAGMGDLTTFSQSLGVSTQQLLLIGGTGLLLGWVANNLVTGAGKRVKRARSSARRRARRSREAIKGVATAPVPVWTVALGALAVGAMLYFVWKMAKGPQTTAVSK